MANPHALQMLESFISNRSEEFITEEKEVTLPVFDVLSFNRLNTKRAG